VGQYIRTMSGRYRGHKELPPVACSRAAREHNNDRMASPTFADEFDGTDLDRDVWLPHYLPAWSSRAESRATTPSATRPCT
jgi:hypothetical protein